jgi:hypothetical protein
MTQPRHPYPPPTARRRSPVPWVVLAVAVAVIGVVLGAKLLTGNGDEEGAQPVAAAEQDPLLVAVAKCDPAKAGLKLSDGNRKLTVNRSGSTDKSGIGADGLACVLDTLQVPGALSDRMLDTTAADGQLRGDWPGYSVTWTHDDAKGLDLTVTRN